jgi:hypothetical protein
MWVSLGRVKENNKNIEANFEIDGFEVFCIQGTKLHRSSACSLLPAAFPLPIA